MTALREAFIIAAVMCLIAAACSMLRAKIRHRQLSRQTITGTDLPSFLFFLIKFSQVESKKKATPEKSTYTGIESAYGAFSLMTVLSFVLFTVSL